MQTEMSKTILGLDLGTNSIGWALIQQNFQEKQGRILGMGSRIIPMSQDILGKFDSGQSHSQTAERTGYRATRRLYQRNNLRRERLHRVLNILGFLPEHYAASIDFEKKLGQFKPNTEEKINYRRNEQGSYDFLFMDSFQEMVAEFKKSQPHLFYKKGNGEETKIPYDWTLYYLRKKALSKRLTKEELAWVILNFNQKRGYYQLRGEEIDDDKDKQFIHLKVKDVIDSGETVKGKILYNVIFENGWPYDKQITKTEDWIGRTKEFIVTISTLKSGETKYSYKTVNSEKDWIAIKTKTEQDIEQSGKTVGEFIYETLLKNPTQKIRGKLVKTIERKFYKEEFEKILSKQIELQPELFTDKLYKSCIKELYPRNEAHQNSIKDKGFEYLFKDDVIFYQRPLKSQKSTISGCQFEYRIYKKKNAKTGKEEEIKKPIQVSSKSHPLFQEFRIWQWLQNLRIYNNEAIINGKLEDVTKTLLPDEDAWTALFDFLNTKKEIEQKSLIDYFFKKNIIDRKQKESYRWNYVEDKKYPMAETRVQLVNRLKKVNKVTNPKAFLDEKTQVGDKFTSREEQLWHIIYSVSDLKEYKKALEKFAVKHQLNIDSFVENFIKFPPFGTDYCSFSIKALKKIVPLMRMGNYWNENDIVDKVKERVDSIMERVNSLSLKENHSEKDLAEAILNVSDEDIPKQLVKSFIPMKNKNPLQGLNTYQATYLVYERHSELDDIQQWKSPADIDNYLKKFKQHSLRNPIVEQVVAETLRVVRDIWNYYGAGVKTFFNEIHVELGREMKSPADKRKKMADGNRVNENTNHRIKEVLKELMNDDSIEGEVRSHSPSHQEILKIYEEGVYQNPEVKFNKVSEEEINKIRKNSNPTKNEIQRYRLWLEQGYISPYTGKPIPLSKLFTHHYQIEHIIPQSRYFDNSLSNKVICESDVNDDKGNQTAYSYLKSKKGCIVNGHKLHSLEEYELHINKHFKSNQQKLKNLLSEDIPEGFINRQLNDSRYISKLVKGILSNVVREENEQEATSKNLIPVTGSITSKLKHDWGLNDKWNELITPRFKRLNQLTNSTDFGFWDNDINAFRIQVPDDISKGFSSKRIDHRHHAMDALVVACTTREHTHYLNALNSEKGNYSLRDRLLIKNEKGDYTRNFQMPWLNFPIEAKHELERIIISFKQNVRVINKTNNKFWSYKDENGDLNMGKDGSPKKKLRKQTKGDNWAIRKPLHNPMPYGTVILDFDVLDIQKNVGKRNLIIDDKIRVRVIETFVRNEENISKTENYFKANPLLDEYGNKIEKTHFKIKNKKYGKRQPISKLFDKKREGILKNILKVGDYLLQLELITHLNQYLNDSENAFTPEGIDNFNEKRKQSGKTPIHKLKFCELGSKRFSLGNKTSNKHKKMEATDGTNLFFAIYWDEEKQKRTFDTIPLNEVIIHQKTVAHLPKNERTPIPPKAEKGKFLFSLSPYDLIYMPTDDEKENAHLVDIRNLNNTQKDRIFVVNDFSNDTCYYTPNQLAKAITLKEVDMKFDVKKEKITGSFDTKTASFEGNSIKESCWKLNVDRLGNIVGVQR